MSVHPRNFSQKFDHHEETLDSGKLSFRFTFRTSQRARCDSIRKTRRRLMCGDIMTVLCGNKTGIMRINVPQRRVRATVVAMEKQ